MTKRRRLGDLWVTGRELTLDDGHGDPVVIWVQKLSPLDHDTALRKAGAARALAVARSADPESEEWQIAHSDMRTLADHDSAIEIVLREERSKRLLSAEAEISDAEEWSKDDYLQGLFDAWHEGKMSERYAADPEDPEARRVFNELKRFNDAVSGRVDEEIASSKAAWDNRPEDELYREATRCFLEQRATNAFMEAYQRAELFLAVRKPDKHDEYYFQSLEEVERLQPQALELLRVAYMEVAVDPLEGKDSQQAPSSSPSSDQPDEPAAAVPSGPPAAVP